MSRQKTEKPSEVQNDLLEVLFDVVLEYKPGIKSVVIEEGREGEFIGTTEGIVKGEKIIVSRFGQLLVR